MKKQIATTLFTTFGFLALTSCHAEEFGSDAELVSALESVDAAIENFPSTDKNVENVIVDSRPLSQEKRVLMEEQRQSEQQYSEEASLEDGCNVSTPIIPTNWENALAVTKIPINYFGDQKEPGLSALIANEMNATAAEFSPYVYHWFDQTTQGNILKLEDGSEWIFDKDKASLVRDWKSGDTIVLAPKGWSLWGSNYAYTIINKEWGESVDANLFLGPLAFGNYTSWVIGIDVNLGQVYLINGEGERSVWEVASQDLYLFEDWTVNDTLFVGQNNSWLWWFSSHNHVLVNVNMNHYVRARLVSSAPNFKTAIGFRG